MINRRSMLWALLAGALILVLVVLPAGVGVDPTGFGRLTGLSTPAHDSRSSAAMPVAGAPPPLSIWSISHPEKYRTQTFAVPLKPNEEVEYKAQLNRGEPLLYSWRVKEGSQVYFEFHGQPTEGTWPKDYYQSYEKGEGSGGQGSMVAPFAGRHGWFWLNIGDKPVTIEIEINGYFSDFSRFDAAHAVQR